MKNFLIKKDEKKKCLLFFSKKLNKIDCERKLKADKFCSFHSLLGIIFLLSLTIFNKSRRGSSIELLSIFLTWRTGFCWIYALWYFHVENWQSKIEILGKNIVEGKNTWRLKYYFCKRMYNWWHNFCFIRFPQKHYAFSLSKNFSFKESLKHFGLNIKSLKREKDREIFL